jgi:citrate lyase subunit beta / citryl-CoA lyase
MLAKARGLEVDEIVLDLEDAVAPGEKAAARAAVVDALAAGGFAAGRVAVRVNAPGTPWCHEDIVELASAPVPPVSLVIPKVEREAELVFAELLLDAVRARAGRDPAVRLQALIETARGVAVVDRVADAAGPRLEALIVGYADLAASLGRRDGGLGHGAAWQAVQDRVLVAARANGLAAIDGPCLQIDPGDTLREQIAVARGLGYDGKWAIHPSQIAPITEAFTPTAGECAHAQATLDALAAAEGAGAGAAAVAGAMVDEASRRRAEAVLARARRS